LAYPSGLLLLHSCAPVTPYPFVRPLRRWLLHASRHLPSSVPSHLYALYVCPRGQVVADLWAPFRTTDYSAWRSNPTMDYNQQALYSGVYASNHVDLAGPYYDFVDQALARSERGLCNAATTRCCRTSQRMVRAAYVVHLYLI
jgi:hypothetical protein